MLMTPETSPSGKWKSKTGSTRGTFKRNGEVLGIVWYSGSTVSSPPPKASPSTTRASFKDPGEKQPLTAYDPNALRK